MAARDDVITVPRATWTKLSNGSVLTDITVILLADTLVFLKATTADTAPTGTTGAPLTAYANGWSEATLAEKFTGVDLSSAAYLWAYVPNGEAPNAPVDFYISHA